MPKPNLEKRRPWIPQLQRRGWVAIFILVGQQVDAVWKAAGDGEAPPPDPEQLLPGTGGCQLPCVVCGVPLMGTPSPLSGFYEPRGGGTAFFFDFGGS